MLSRNQNNSLEPSREALEISPDDELFLSDIAHLALLSCRTSSAAISLLGANGQWRTRTAGAEECDLARAETLFAQTVFYDDIHVTAPAGQAQNEVPRSHPFSPPIRFYAGAPLTSSEGEFFGVLAVMDTDAARSLDREQMDALRRLARQTVSHAEMRRQIANQEALLAGHSQAATAAKPVVHRDPEMDLKRLAAIVDSFDEAVLGATLDGAIVHWNKGAEKLYGYSAGEILGKNTSFLSGEGEHNLLPGVTARLMRGETIDPVEVSRRRKDGSQFFAALSFSPIRGAEEEITGVSCIARDITARVAAERARAESEARLRRLTDAAFEGVSVWQNGLLVEASPALATMFGYDTPAEMLGFTPEALMTPESRTIILQNIAANYEQPYEALLRRRDGSTFDAEIRGHIIALNGEQARVTAVRDISDRKAMEAELRESRRFAESISENSASIIFVFDLDAKENVYSNRNLTDFLGYSFSEAAEMGPNLLEAIIHPEDIPRLVDHIDRFGDVPDGVIVDIEYRVRHVSGAWRWIWSREVVFERHTDGRASRILGNVQDITKIKELEAQLCASAEQLSKREAALSALLQSAPVVLYAADANGIVVLSEGMGLTALGLKPGEAVGRSVFDFTGGDPEMETNTRRALAGEAVSYDTRAGQLYLHVELQPVRDADGAFGGLIGVCFDVTERVVSEERFRVLFEQSSDAIFLLDPVTQGGIVDCNAAALSLLGGSEKADLLGLNPMDFSPEMQPDGQRSSEKKFRVSRQLRDYGGTRFEWTHERPDRTQIDVEVTQTTVSLSRGATVLSVCHDLTDQKRIEQEIRDYASILHHQKEALEQAAQDLARRNEDLSRARDAAQSATKAKSAFLASMSHEIRTPMNGVLGMTSLLLDTNLTDEQRDYAETVRSSGQSLLTILNDILDFSKIEAGKLDFEHLPFDLRRTVADIVSLMGGAARTKGLQVIFDVDNDVPSALIGDAGRLRQIMANIVGNSIKFTERGRVTVRVQLGELTERDALIEFRVTDTGIGISEEAQKRLFQSFSQADASTTRRFGGSGLGLAICKQLVEIMGGQIGVLSVIGQGSTFWFSVRLARHETESPSPSPAIRQDRAPRQSAAVSSQGACILLVEDNAINQKVAKRLLEKQGHSVDVACNGREAVAMAGDKSYDLVLMDCQMPEMDGWEATRAIRKREGAGADAGRLPIVALTAGAMAEDRAECFDAGMDGFLTKPFKTEDLYTVLSTYLR